MRDSKTTNEVETRRLYVDLHSLLGINTRVTKHFMKLIQEAMVHKVVQDKLECKEESLQNTVIEIPFVGGINITFNDDGSITSTVELEDEMKEQLLKARNEGVSPLLNRLEDAVVQTIMNEYQPLI